MYTDKTILMFGEYKFTRLRNVPADYLLMCYRYRIFGLALLDYIERNFEKIRLRAEKQKPLQSFGLPCKKRIYRTEKAALNKLVLLQKTEKYKNTLRAYPCYKCGGWHLTSMTEERWKELEWRLGDPAKRGELGVGS